MLRLNATTFLATCHFRSLILAVLALGISTAAQPNALARSMGVDQQSESKVKSDDDAPDSEAAEFDFFSGQAPTSIAQLKQMQEHFAKLSEKVKPATVNIQVGAAQGSGVIVSRDGYVLTAAHVVGAPNRSARIQLPDGTTLNAKTLGLNRTLDSGLLKITDEGKFPYHLDIGESNSLKLGQWVMAIGHPEGWNEDRGLVVRVGRVVSKTSRTIGSDCSLVGGDSGGPLVDMNGDVVGIHSRIGRTLNDNWHVPVDTFTDGWDRLVAAEDWGSGPGGRPSAWIGVERFVDETLEIESVAADGPADKAGLKEGDILLEFRGVEIKSQFELGFAIRRTRPGDKIKIRYKRGDKTDETELIVGVRAR